MKKLILFCLLGCSVVVFGQEDVKANVPLDARNITGKWSGYGAGTWLPGKSIDNSIEGTPHLFSNWNGVFQIFVNENQSYKISNLNYNIVSKTLESQVEKDSVFQFDTSKINSIKRNSDKYKFFNINNSNELYQVIYSSQKVVFLKGFSVEITKENVNPMTQEVLSKRKYKIKERFMINFNNSSFIEIDMKKKQILKLMGDKASQVEKYASDSKLSFTSEKELFSIFRFYDNL